MFKTTINPKLLNQWIPYNMEKLSKNLEFTTVLFHYL